jgi:phage protein D
LISLTITDEPGLKTDKLDLVFADQNNGSNLELSKIGDLLKISLGYKESGICEIGTVAVDDYTQSPKSCSVHSLVPSAQAICLIRLCASAPKRRSLLNNHFMTGYIPSLQNIV